MQAKGTRVVVALVVAVSVLAACSRGLAAEGSAPKGAAPSSTAAAKGDDPTGKKEAQAFLAARAAEFEAQESGWQAFPRQKPGESPWIVLEGEPNTGMVQPYSLRALGGVATLRRHLCNIQWKSINNPETPAGPVLARFEIVSAYHNTLAVGVRVVEDLMPEIARGASRWEGIQDEKGVGEGFSVQAILYWVTLNDSAHVAPVATGLIDVVNPSAQSSITSVETPDPLSVRVDVVAYPVLPKSVSGRALDDRLAVYIEGELGWVVDDKHAMTVSSKTVATKYMNAVVSPFDLSLQRVHKARAPNPFVMVKPIYHPARTPEQLAEVERYMREQFERAATWGAKLNLLSDPFLGFRYSRKEGLRRARGRGIPLPILPQPEPLDFSDWD